MIPTRQKILKLALFVCIFALGMNKISDFDVWYHIKTGEYIITHHAIPHHDIFSYTTKEPWLTHEWLSQIIFYLVCKAGGFAGIMLFRALLLCFLFYFLLRFVSRRTPVVTHQVLSVLLAVIASAGSFLERPQLFSYLLFVIFYDALTQFKEGRRQHVWLCVFLALLWVNLHSSFILGLLLIFLFAFSEAINVIAYGKAPEKLNHLITVFLCGAFVSLANPNHVKMFLYPFETLFNKQHMDLIFEWQSPNFHLVQMQVVELFIFLTVAAMLSDRGNVKKRELFFFFFFLHFALHSLRNLPYFAFVCAPLFAAHIGAFSQKTNRFLSHIPAFNKLASADEKASVEIPALNALLLIFLVGFCVSRIPCPATISKTVSVKDFPARAVSYLKSHPLEGNLFNEYDWGGYLIFELYPQRKVFIDGRMDIHVKTTVPDYLKLMRYEKGWEAVVKKYNLRLFLLRKNNILARILRENKNFRVLFEDKTSVLFVRDG